MVIQRVIHNIMCRRARLLDGTYFLKTSAGCLRGPGTYNFSNRTIFAPAMVLSFRPIHFLWCSSGLRDSHFARTRSVKPRGATPSYGKGDQIIFGGCKFFRCRHVHVVLWIYDYRECFIPPHIVLTFTFDNIIIIINKLPLF